MTREKAQYYLGYHDLQSSNIHFDPNFIYEIGNWVIRSWATFALLNFISLLIFL